jgi:RNA polymerase subunit RPABC4/transcription elongation factor Spt4
MATEHHAIRFDPAEFPAEPRACLRCGAVVPMRFRGACPACAAELREKYRGEARVVAGAEYEPAMHVTPNAVALKDD